MGRSPIYPNRFHQLQGDPLGRLHRFRARLSSSIFILSLDRAPAPTSSKLIEIIPLCLEIQASTTPVSNSTKRYSRLTSPTPVLSLNPSPTPRSAPGSFKALISTLPLSLLNYHKELNLPCLIEFSASRIFPWPATS